MNKKQLQQKLSKLIGRRGVNGVSQDLVDFVIEASKNGLPDFKAELRADKEAELLKVEQRKVKLQEEIEELQ
jgi:hypothetical protein